MARTDKWRHNYTRELSNRGAEYEMRRINERARKESTDTQIRREVQILIIDLVSKGETLENIIEILSQNPNYSKYAVYFPTWIKNFQRKLKSKKQKEEEER